MTIQTIKTNTFILQMGKPRLPVPQMGRNQAGGGPLPYGTNHLFPIRIPTSNGGRKRGGLGRAGDEGQTRGWWWTGGRGGRTCTGSLFRPQRQWAFPVACLSHPCLGHWLDRGCRATESLSWACPQLGPHHPLWKGCSGHLPGVKCGIRGTWHQ